jgi:hypothetical protein
VDQVLADLRFAFDRFVASLRDLDWERVRSMELPPLSLDLLQSIALGIALAACAGVRAWLPLFATGVAVRLGLLNLGESFGFIGSNTALLVFSFATLIEFLADKVPVVDHALDSISTVLKPIAGAVLAASVLWTVDDPLVALALGVMVGAPSALVPHAAKATVRGVLNPLTAGLTAPVLSLIEDVIAFGLVALAILLPLLAVALFIAFALFTGRFARGRTTADGASEVAHA